MDYENLFDDTKVSINDQKLITKKVINLIEDFSKHKNKEFGKYILNLLKEYPEIIPQKDDLNFFFDDLEREYDLNLNEIEKELE